MAKVAKSRQKNSSRGSKPGERRGGRKKGTPNKVTADVRAFIALIVERNVEKLEGWINTVAIEDPAKAAHLFLAVLEYNQPKLARSEVSGKDGAPILPPVIQIVPVRAAPRE